MAGRISDGVELCGPHPNPTRPVPTREGLGPFFIAVRWVRVGEHWGAFRFQFPSPAPSPSRQGHLKKIPVSIRFHLFVETV